jgi:F420-dependent oxidoreductase-like protein
MSVGVLVAAEKTENSIDNLIEQTRQAAEAGIRSVWFSQQVENDAISVAALAGSAVPEVTVGTSVVPIFPRNPLVLGGQAQTAQAATHGRFVLGLGLGAKSILEPLYGTSYPPPIRHLREYLTVLRQMFAGEQVAFDGEIIRVHPSWPTILPGSASIPLLVAAMGPQALRVTGELADGTLPFLAGPKALAQEIVPVITKAAETAGRPSPRIVAFVPAFVTDDVDAVREIAAGPLSGYDSVPSYRRIIDAEGVAGAAEIAVIGDEKVVAAAIQRYYDAGATEVVITQAGIPITEEQRLRTWQLLGELG